MCNNAERTDGVCRVPRKKRIKWTLVLTEAAGVIQWEVPLSVIHIIYTIELQTGYFQRPRELFRIPSLIISVSAPSILPSMLHWQKSLSGIRTFLPMCGAALKAAAAHVSALTGLQLHVLFSWTPTGVTRKSLMTTSDARKHVNQWELKIRPRFGTISVKVLFLGPVWWDQGCRCVDFCIDPV